MDFEKLEIPPKVYRREAENNNGLLTPCSPCVCPESPCEQCMFGYRSQIDAHNLMKDLIQRVENGEKPVGWILAKIYKDYHPNWAEQLKGETYVSFL